MSAGKRITRRAFVARAVPGAAGLQVAVAASAPKQPKRYRGASAQTYVWSQVLQQQGKSLSENLDSVFAATRSAGFDAVETMVQFVQTADSAARLADLLGKYQLRLSGIYGGGLMHETEAGKRTVARLAGLAERIKRLGCDVLVFNPNPIRSREKTQGELETQAALLNKLGRTLGESSIALNVHCHAPEMRSDAREFRSNLDRTDPSLVWLNADVHWIYRGGNDPYELLDRYADRIGSCHLRNSVDGVWSEALGDGDVDYRRIVKIFATIKTPMWLTVELAYEKRTKQTRPLAENLARSRRYIREVFGV